MSKVVHDVSSGTMSLPGNQPYPNDYMWYSAQYVQSYGALDPYNWQPGMIVQMRTWNSSTASYGPHTAMVISNNGGNITFVESNYTTHYTVDIRQVTRANFLAQTEGPVGNKKYTVYEIH